MRARACHHRAHGVVASHPLSMREALGSIPSVSIPFATRDLSRKEHSSEVGPCCPQSLLKSSRWWQQHQICPAACRCALCLRQRARHFVRPPAFYELFLNCCFRLLLSYCVLACDRSWCQVFASQARTTDARDRDRTVDVFVGGCHALHFPLRFRQELCAHCVYLLLISLWLSLRRSHPTPGIEPATSGTQGGKLTIRPGSRLFVEWCPPLLLSPLLPAPRLRAPPPPSPPPFSPKSRRPGGGARLWGKRGRGGEEEYGVVGHEMLPQSSPNSRWMSLFSHKRFCSPTPA